LIQMDPLNAELVDEEKESWKLVQQFLSE
jgi:hypothetical protein